MSRYRKLVALVACVVVSGALVGGSAYARSSGGVSRTCLQSEDPCLGTNRSDSLTSSTVSLGVEVNGLAGNDIITGRGLGDTLIGGRGTDIINGGGGDFIDSQDRTRPSTSRSARDIVNCKPGDTVIAFDTVDQLNGCI